MTTDIRTASGPRFNTPAGPLDRELQAIRSEPGAVEHAAAAVRNARATYRPFTHRVKVAALKLWRNKGLYAGFTCFTTAAAQFGWVPGLITAGISVIISDVLK